MKIPAAINSLAALAQETRLNIFRLLVRHVPEGLPAGTIARRLRLPGPTLSFHLNVLAAAELIEPRKNGRSISYSARLDSVPTNCFPDGKLLRRTRRVCALYRKV